MDVRMTRIREEDLGLVMDWRMRPYVTRFMNTDPVLTIEGQKNWFHRLQSRDDQIHWIIRHSTYEGEGGHVPIGLINVFDIDRTNSRCSWGWYIAEREYRSLKLALFLEWSLYDYVFDVLGLHKLCNETWVENKQVVQLHKMAGSKEDGIMRDQIFKNGEYHDVSIGSILADEWRGMRSTTSYERFPFE